MSGEILIVGAGSRVGRMLAACWPGGGSGVTWCGRRRGKARWALKDGAEALAPVAADARALVCLAGVTGWAEEDLEDNTRLACAAVRAAHLVGQRARVFVISSMAVYGAAGGVVGEDGPTVPLNPYGAAKLRMERAAIALGRALGVPVTILRLGNVVGADSLFRNVEARRDIVLDRFADGVTPVRSYVDPERLAWVLSGLATRACAGDGLPEVLNVAAGPALEMGGLLRAAGIAFDTRPAPDTALARAEMDLTALARVLPGAERPVTADQAVAAWRKVRAEMAA